MTAFHIISIYFQLRLCIHACVFCQTQILVHLLRIGLHRTGTHQDFSCKSADSRIIEHVLEQFAAHAMRSLVVYDRIIVHMLLLVSNDKPVEHSLCPLAFQCHSDGVACQAVGERHPAHAER